MKICYITARPLAYPASVFVHTLVFSQNLCDLPKENMQKWTHTNDGCSFAPAVLCDNVFQLGLEATCSISKRVCSKLFGKVSHVASFPPQLRNRCRTMFENINICGSRMVKPASLLLIGVGGTRALAHSIDLDRLGMCQHDSCSLSSW